MKPTLADFPSLESLQEIIDVLKEIQTIHGISWAYVRRKWIAKSIEILEEEIKIRKGFEASLRSTFLKYCAYCYKPHSCVLGCKVKFTVNDLKVIVGDG